jgi:hypothetical protein
MLPIMSFIFFIIHYFGWQAVIGFGAASRCRQPDLNLQISPASSQNE